MAKLDSISGNYTEAIKHMCRNTLLNNAFKTKKEKATQLLLIEYDVDKKEREIEIQQVELERQKQ